MTFSAVSAAIAKPLRNAVIVDLVGFDEGRRSGSNGQQRSKRVTKHECMALLHQHIRQNTWQVSSPSHPPA